MKRTLIWTLLLSPILLIAVKLAFAQCGASLTSCYVCHEIENYSQERYDARWHLDHSFANLCEFCHEGEIIPAEKKEAHVGLKTKPWKTPETSCKPCHENDFKEKARKYMIISEKKAGNKNEKPADNKHKP